MFHVSRRIVTYSVDPPWRIEGHQQHLVKVEVQWSPSTTIVLGGFDDESWHVCVDPLAALIREAIAAQPEED
jgi:hypothetical protein